MFKTDSDIYVAIFTQKVGIVTDHIEKVWSPPSLCEGKWEHTHKPWLENIGYNLIGCFYFIGEDLNSKARRKYQQEQLREWSTEQKEEREQAERNQNTADRLYDLKMKELDQRAMELAKAEEDCRRAINVATKDYNNALVK